MIRVGVTGGIGAGKSVVSTILLTMGFPVFNSDKEAKDIVNSDPHVRSQLIDLLGKGIYTNTGIDRPKLASLIFRDEELRGKVNAIIHPAVRKAFDDFCSRSTSSIVFNEAAILFETGAYKKFDFNILIVAPLELRIHRVIARDHSDPNDVKKRILAQWDDDKKMSLADFTVVNDEKQPLLIQIEKIVDQLISSKSSK